MIDDLMSNSIDIGERVAAFILQLKLKTPEAADTVNGWWFEGSDNTTGNTKKFRGESRDHLLQRCGPRLFADPGAAC